MHLYRYTSILLIAFFLAACGSPQPAEAATKAMSIQFLLSQVRTTAGPLSGGKVDFYAAGTTTRKTVWLDRNKATPAANPYTLDSNGTAAIFGDGLYRIVIKDSAGVTKYDRDYISIKDASNLAYDVADYASLAAACAALNGTGATLQYSTDQTLTANLVTDVELMPINGAVINHGAYTISYAGPNGDRLRFNGTGAVSGIDTTTPWMFLAVGDGVADDTTAVQRALASGRTLDHSGGTFAVTGVTVPATVKEVRGNGTLVAYANGATVMEVLTDISRAGTRKISVTIAGNGKTGVTGLKLGATESALYLNLDNVTVNNCETGIFSLVTMESAWTNVSVNGCTVGIKIYNDLNNGGQNANSYRGIRVWNCTVGILLRTYANYGASNNNFTDVTIQESAVCGFAAYGAYKIDALSLTGIHIEGGFGGAATTVVDGITIRKSAIYLVNTDLTLNATQIAASISPWLIGETGSTVTYNGLTAYGSASGTLFSLDATSFAYETGSNSPLGIKKIESYGALSLLSSTMVNGAPKITLGTYENHSTMPNPAIPLIDNSPGVTSAGFGKDPHMGVVSSVVFAPSAGNLSTNNNYWDSGSGVSGEYALLSVLVKSSDATSFTFYLVRDGAYLTQTIAFKAGEWRRVMFAGVLNSTTGFGLYIYPTTAAGATLSFKGHQYLHTTDLSKISNAYQNGLVGVKTEQYESVTAMPNFGTWTAGEVVWRTPQAIGQPKGWVRLTTGSAHVLDTDWRSMGNL